MNAASLRARWNLINPSVRTTDYVKAVRQLPGDFVAILYRDNRAGDNSEPIARLNSLNVFSRRRIRAPFHVTLRSAQEPQLEHGRFFSGWNWQVTPEMLEDAIEFAAATDFAVTMSTVKSGASRPLNIHLQGVPCVFQWEDEEYRPFNSLVASPAREEIQSRKARISILEFPLPVARIAGGKAEVCEKCLAMAIGYDGLRAYNLIVVKLDEMHEQEVAAFFVPRRLDGQVIPSAGPLRSAFGSWEVAGCFLTKDMADFSALSTHNIQSMLADVGITPRSTEYDLFRNLLIYP